MLIDNNGDFAVIHHAYQFLFLILFVCILPCIQPAGLYEFFIIFTIIIFGWLLVISYIYVAKNNIHLSPVKNDLVSQSSHKSKSASQSVFYRVYEVVAALSVFVASTGVLLNNTSKIPSVYNPVTIMTSHSVQFLLFIVFVITSIQFIVGTSQHFELVELESDDLAISLLRYILITGQAFSLLAMAESVATSSLIEFFNWYIVLLVFDTLWIFISYLNLAEFLRHRNFNRRKLFTSVRRVLKLISISSPDTKIRRFVYGYWMSANAAYLVILMSVVPDELTGHLPFRSFFTSFAVLLFAITMITTWLNKSCLEWLAIL